MEKDEIHLVILWNKAKCKRDEIISDLQDHFNFIACYEIEWSKVSLQNNYRRLFGALLSSKYYKECEYVDNKILLLVFLDKKSNFETRETFHGSILVNNNVEDALTRFQLITNDLNGIYASISPIDTNRVLTLLLGVNTEDYVKEIKEIKLDGNPIRIKRDVSGEKGWQNLKEFFYVLNNTIKYVVMRGEENLSDMKSEEHGDIDLLVKEWDDALNIMNGEKVFFSSPYRPKVLVSTKQDGCFLFDLWKSSLSYHSQAWHDDMFQTRKYTGLFYILNDENNFYSRLYHCLVHKKKVASDYKSWFVSQYHNLGLEKKYDLSKYKYPMDMFYQILLDYVIDHKYEFTYAKEDTHCIFNERIIKIDRIIKSLEENTEVRNIKPFGVAERPLSEYFYFVGTYKQESVLIKYGGIKGLCQHEYMIKEKLLKCSSIGLVKPIKMQFVNGTPFLIYKYIEGERLSDCDVSMIDKKEISKQIKTIYNSLVDCNIMHRNINPGNFIISGTKIFLINFEFAIETDIKKAPDCLIDNRSLLLNLDNKYRPNRYCWSDDYSLKVIEKEYGLNLDMANEIKPCIMKLPITFVVSNEMRRILGSLFFKLKKIVFVVKHKVNL